MKSELTLKGLSIDYLKECFYIKDWVLYWKDRKQEHFKTEKAWKIFKSKFSGKPAGKNNHGYLQTKISYRMHSNHRIIYFMLKGEIPNVVDHIDGNTLNNDIKNLRSVTVSNNAMNCKTSVNNTSGQKGVYFHKSIGKYTASIRVDGKLTHLGTFINFDLAKEARLESEKKYYGDYANGR